MAENKSQLRPADSPIETYADRVFESEINKTIVETKRHYDAMMYKEVLKTGFYEFQTARDRYRELSFESGQHAGLITRFIDVQLILLSPICTHLCEYIWTTILGNKTSILKAKWPEAGKIDEGLLSSANYLAEVAHDFRNRHKNFAASKAKGAKSKENVEKPSQPVKGTIFVAKTFPLWQQIVLETLKNMYQAKNQFPDNKSILVELNNKEELKKFQKKVMPFVAFLKEQVQKKGLSCLNQTLDFDEHQVLITNLKYLKNTLQLNDLDVMFTTDIKSDSTSPQLNFDDVVPGKPLIFYE